MRFATVGLLAASLFGWTSAAAVSQTQEKDLRAVKLGGKTLDEWLKDVTSTDRSRGETALQFIQKWPGEEVYRAGGAKIFIDELSRHKGHPIGVLGDGPNLDLSIRVNLAMTIGHVLGGALDSKELKVEPAEIKKAVKMLTGFLGDQQLIMQYRAAEALGKIGPEANEKETVRRLINLVGNTKTWEVRQAGALALGHIAKDTKNGPPVEVLNALYSALYEPRKGFQGGEPAARVRLAAVQSLTWLGGPPSADYRKAMIKNLDYVAGKDSNPTVQIWAQMAVMSIEKEFPEERISAVGRRLAHTDQAVRIQAAQALAHLGNKAKTQVPLFSPGLKEEDPAIIYWWIFALNHIGDDAAALLPELNGVKNNMKLPESLRKAAEQLIKKLEKK